MSEFLSETKDYLKERSYEVRYVKSSEEHANPHLIIELPADDVDEESYPLIVVPQSTKEYKDYLPSCHSFDIIQFIYEFSSRIKSDYISQTLRSLQLINKLSPLSCFYFDEQENKIVFQYTLTYTSQPITMDSFEAILNMVEDILNCFVPKLKAIVEGQLTFREFAEDEGVDTLDNTI